MVPEVLHGTLSRGKAVTSSPDAEEEYRSVRYLPLVNGGCYRLDPKVKIHMEGFDTFLLLDSWIPARWRDDVFIVRVLLPSGRVVQSNLNEIVRLKRLS